MLILNMAMNIHITVRYLQLRKEFKEFTKSEAIIEASKKMMLPIFILCLLPFVRFCL